jgi:hypothetical protein
MLVRFIYTNIHHLAQLVNIAAQNFRTQWSSRVESLRE